jgi:hypothetical protein
VRFAQSCPVLHHRGTPLLVALSGRSEAGGNWLGYITSMRVRDADRMGAWPRREMSMGGWLVQIYIMVREEDKV